MLEVFYEGLSKADVHLADFFLKSFENPQECLKSVMLIPSLLCVVLV